MAMNVAGKTAIITGAGSGINFCFAELLLKKNCNVLIGDIALRPEAEELIEQYSGDPRSKARAIFQKTNVREWAELERLFITAEQSFGGVDIVCPGAGVYEPPWSNFWYPPGIEPSIDSSRLSRYAELDINLTHPIRSTQLAISQFLNPRNPEERRPVSPSNPRCIIHVSSVAGQSTPMLAPIYNAAKHALNGFVRSLAPLEKEMGIRVVAVAPGVIKTPLWTENPDKLRLIAEDDEWVTPEFVAENMVKLVEEEEIGIHTLSGGTTMVKVEGGFILEVCKHLRQVEQYNDPGPRIGGKSVSNMSIAQKEILERLRTKGWGVI